MTTTVTRGSIVVGVDDSAGSRAALTWAASAAEAHGCSLTLMHCYPDVRHLPTRGFSFPVAEMVAESAAIMDRAEAQLLAEGWTGDPVARVSEGGPPAAFLKRHGREARMVVVGRRGTGGFRDMLVGSTAYGIAEYAPTPVVIVPADWDPTAVKGRAVVLGLDSDSGDAAIGFAFDVATLTSQHLDATHVIGLPVFAFIGTAGYWPSMSSWPGTDDSLDEVRRGVAEQLAGWSERYPDVKVERNVVVGSPAGELLAQGHGASLLVVGGRDHGGLASALLGSVARNLIHHATCPIAVVHRAR